MRFFVFSVSSGGKRVAIPEASIPSQWWIFSIIWTKSVSMCPTKYTSIPQISVKIGERNILKNKRIVRRIRNLRNRNQSVKKRILSSGIAEKTRIPIYRSDCPAMRQKITAENHKNFPSTNSERSMGLERMRKIVFPSISFSTSWLPINTTPMSPKISIIDTQKSRIILFSSPMARLLSTREKSVKRIPKKKMSVKKRLRIISLKVLRAIRIIYIIGKYRREYFFVHWRNLLYSFSFFIQAELQKFREFHPNTEYNIVHFV